MESYTSWLINILHRFRSNQRKTYIISVRAWEIETRVSVFPHPHLYPDASIVHNIPWNRVFFYPYFQYTVMLNSNIPSRPVGFNIPSLEVSIYRPVQFHTVQFQYTVWYRSTVGYVIPCRRCDGILKLDGRYIETLGTHTRWTVYWNRVSIYRPIQILSYFFCMGRYIETR